LTYSDIARKAEFTGGVSAVDSDGTMHGQQVVVYLQGAPVGDDKKKVAPLSGLAGFMGGRVDRMVATGRVEMDQPGRKATGEQLVYTASDQTYLLTGTGAVAPKIVDDTRGTTTGSALRFHAGDNSVVVVNDAGSDAGRKVRTETQVKQ
jgi:lipopolysaccharide export system protein LptA